MNGSGCLQRQSKRYTFCGQPLSAAFLERTQTEASFPVIPSPPKCDPRAWIGASRLRIQGLQNWKHGINSLTAVEGPPPEAVQGRNNSGVHTAKRVGPWCSRCPDPDCPAKAKSSARPRADLHGFLLDASRPRRTNCHVVQYFIWGGGEEVWWARRAQLSRGPGLAVHPPLKKRPPQAVSQERRVGLIKTPWLKIKAVQIKIVTPLCPPPTQQTRQGGGTTLPYFSPTTIAKSL